MKRFSRLFITLVPAAALVLVVVIGLGSCSNPITNGLITGDNTPVGVNNSADRAISQATVQQVSALNLTTLVTAPALGEVPDIKEINTEQYTGTIEWKDADDAAFAGTFDAGTAYKAIVTLTAKSGYTFNGLGKNSFTYKHATVKNAKDSGTVTIRF
jgi:opacity protein-like surface antigen